MNKPRSETTIASLTAYGFGTAILNVDREAFLLSTYLQYLGYEKRQALKARFEIEQKLRRERKTEKNPPLLPPLPLARRSPMMSLEESKCPCGLHLYMY